LCGVLNSHVIDEPITEITLQEQIDGSVWDSSRRKASDDYPTFSPETTDRGAECDSSKHVDRRIDAVETARLKRWPKPHVKIAFDIAIC
jgi:hypothetical protein